VFTNIETAENIIGTKPEYEYNHLDEHGIVREGTAVHDKMILIGMSSIVDAKTGLRKDNSKGPKKGQLGIVDKTVITEGEEGQRIAKVRVREIRIPAIGDKMASRAGQKGTIGLVIPEADMPFTRDGIIPDIIVNPHAIPSRMTIGHLVECITGKACVSLGCFGDATAFNNDGTKIGQFGRTLVNNGFHSSGNDILYNGMTGEQLETEIFFGPTYYMRLKHMVKDKINYRAKGPRTALTRQPVSGRANDGGLRIGEMERDSVISHGAANFLTESMMERGDKYYMAVCNKSGMVAIYNPTKNLFMSPMADGPIKFIGSIAENNMTVENITKHGRSFSIVCIPYSLKLLLQEIQCANVAMRIITDDNIEQIENMSFSKNIYSLIAKEGVQTRELATVESIAQDIRLTLQKSNRKAKDKLFETPISLSPSVEEAVLNAPGSSPYAQGLNAPGSSPYAQGLNAPGSPAYAPGSPAYAQGLNAPGSPIYNPESPPYATGSPIYNPESPPYATSSLKGGSNDLIDMFSIGQTVSLRGIQVGGGAIHDNVWKIQDLGPEFTTVIHERTGDLKVVDNNEICQQPQYQQSQMNYDPYYPSMQGSMQGQMLGPMQGSMQGQPDFQVPMINPYAVKEQPSVVVVVGDKNELHGLSDNASSDAVKIVKKEDTHDNKSKNNDGDKKVETVGGTSSSSSSSSDAWSSLTNLASGFFVKKV